MTKEEWNAFDADMKANALLPNAHTEYGKGDGDDMTEKTDALLRGRLIHQYRSATPEIIRIFISKIVIHEKSAKHCKSATQQIDIYFTHTGKLFVA